LKKRRAATVTRTRAKGEAKRWPLLELTGAVVWVAWRVVEGVLVVLVERVELLDALEVVLALALELWLLVEVVLEAEAEELVRLTVDETVTELLGRTPVPTYWNWGL